MPIKIQILPESIPQENERAKKEEKVLEDGKGRLRAACHSITRIVLWTLAIVFIITFSLRGLSLVLPEKCQWIMDKNIQIMDNIITHITSGGIGVFIGNFFKEIFRD
jgi:hypothetical protein